MSNIHTDHQPIMRERKVYGETLIELRRVLYGFGYEPKTVEMERCDTVAGGRVLFDILIDGRVVTESKTVEQIQVMTEAWEIGKAFMMDVHRRKNGNIKGLYVRPFDSVLMDAVANDASPAVRQMAASRQDTPPDHVKRGPRSDPPMFNGNTDNDSVNKSVPSIISPNEPTTPGRSVRRRVNPYVPARKNFRPRFTGGHR